MSKPKIIAFIVFLVFAASGYIYFYGDYFRKPTIRISHTFRPRSAAMNRRKPDNSAPPATTLNNLIFALDTEFRLTSLKVVLLDEYKTNKYIRPVWELVSSSNSVPTKAFFYGANIGGMHPAIKDSRPDALSNNVPYRLLVEAGRIKGECDFTLTTNNNVVQ